MSTYLHNASTPWVPIPSRNAKMGRTLSRSVYRLGKGILQRMFVVLLLVSLLPLPAMAASTALQNAPAIFVLPTVVHAGGEPRVTGYNLVPKATYRVDFGIDGVPILPQSSFLTDSDSAGEIHTVLSLPYGLEPRTDYTVMVAGPIDNQTDEYYAKFTVLPALGLGLNPAEGPPGTVVEFTVNNLSPGSLRVDFDDATVLGPLPVSGNSYTGVFVVPNGFEPESEPPVTAVNLVNDVVVGSVRQDFRIDAAPQPPIYGLANVEMPTEPVVAGEIFTITGQITPVPTGRTENYYVVALWENDSGQVIPISQEKARLDTAGRFAVAAHLPNFFSGDPYSYANETYNQSHMSLSLVEYNEDTRSTDFITTIEIDLPFVPIFDFAVSVYDIDTKQPIPKAMITIMGLDSELRDFPEYEDKVFPGFYEDEGRKYFGCKGGKVFTDVSESVPFDYDPSIWLAAGINQIDIAQNSASAIYGEIATAHQAAMQSADSSTWEPPSRDWYRFRLYVDALIVGYGPIDENGKPYFDFYKRDIWLNVRTGQIKDIDGADLAQPLPIPLKRFTSADVARLTAIQLLIGGTIARIEGPIPGVNGQWPIYSGVLSFASVKDNPDVTLDVHELVQNVAFELKASAGAHVEETRLYFDNQDLGPFEDFHLATYCDTNVQVARFKKTIALSYFLKPGVHDLKLEVKFKSGDIQIRHIGLEYVELPSWFLDPRVLHRYAHASDHYELYGKVLYMQPYILSSGDETPQLGGPIDNEVSADGWFDGVYPPRFYGVERTTVLDDMAEDIYLTPTGYGSYHFTYGPKMLFDTGYMPLYYNAYVAPFAIVVVTLEISHRYYASIEIEGNISLDPLETDLLIRPSAGLGVQAVIDAYVLWIVAHGQLITGLNLGLDMPTRLHNGNVEDKDVCLKYRSDWHLEWGLICDPLFGLGCVYGDSADGVIFNSYMPKRPPCGSFTQVTAAATYQGPSRLSPALATDGFGQTMMVRPVALDALGVSRYNGVEWQGATTFTTGLGPTDAEIVFFAPNQAMMVWAESSLSQAELDTATLTEAYHSYHLVYATWNGESWSERSNLTSPTTGEGRVALAACPVTQSGCPNGGEITAVWSRDIVGDSDQRQFRLFYAKYRDGAWSAPQPVEPNAPAQVTDHQPSVVYAFKQNQFPNPTTGSWAPEVFWVRDEDSDITTIDDRRIAMRRLDGTATPASSPVIPLLPNRIYEVTAARDGHNNALLAFTRIEENGSLLGNLHNLYIAYREEVSPGLLVWKTHELRDSYGRTIRAEAPILTVDTQGKPTLTFRGMGFGPLADGSRRTVAEDPIGMALGVGELAQLEIKLDNAPHSPSYLTNDGAVNWHPAAVYDPVSNSIIALAVKGEPPVGFEQLQAAQTVQAARAQTIDGSEPIVFASVARQPDFVVAAVVPTPRYPQPGQPVTLTVQLRNDGVAWQGTVTGTLAIVATWNGDYGTGEQAGSAHIEALGAGQHVSVTMALSTPSTGYSQSQMLTVTVNPGQPIPEQNGSNNMLSTLVGGMPAPTDVIAAMQRGSKWVFLQWSELNDDRIVGYHIYRAGQDDAWVSVGSTFAPNFIDLTAEAEHPYRYYVTSYAKNGIESVPGNMIGVTVAPLDETIASVVASNDGPTTLGNPTQFSTSISTGTNVTYTWDFGDSQTGSGASVSHIYAAAGTYTAIVTASNAVSRVDATTTVIVQEATSEPKLYLPLIHR